MYIVMHCGGLPFNGDTINSKSLGGSETAAYYMAKELVKLGHKVTLFTNSEEEGEFDGVRYIFSGIPNERAPLGERFHFYAEQTPHDVLIIQRHPMAFARKYASKMNIIWLHDLALHRTAAMFNSQMWNVDLVLTVSQYHKDQVCDVYGLNPDIVYPITNGVDLALFNGEIQKELLPNLGTKKEIENGVKITKDQISLLYSSRPERGLEYHVKPDGIMERLWKIDQRYHLYVCGYDNVTEQMKPYYEYLWQRCKELPNVTNIGALTKRQLADVMRQCDALVYPTTFEEVSCITAMEAMAAGLPFIASAHAALPETCKDGGSVLIPLKDGQPDIDKFIETIINSKGYRSQEKEMQLEAAEYYTWDKPATSLSNKIKSMFTANLKNPGTVLTHLIDMSDIHAANWYLENKEYIGNLVFDKKLGELTECYKFSRNNTFAEHYKAYYEYEKARGVNYGPETLEKNSRYECVAGIVSSVANSGTVYDYGCAHGHYTVNLAKRFADKQFIGIDITKSNIDTASLWASTDKVQNVNFVHAEHDGLPEDLPLADCIIAAEVLEHVNNPQSIIDGLAKKLKPGGRFVITTPYGPWEAEGYKEHWPWRAHLHHFDRADIKEIFGHYPEFQIFSVPAGVNGKGEPVGSYVYTFVHNGELCGQIDYARHFEALAPRQTLTVCMIAKDAEKTLNQCLDSVSSVADEIIVAIDKTTTDGTEAIAKKYGAVVKYVDSPLEIGFDEARNESIKNASGDWILWIDSDEVLFHPERLFRYLRNNQFNGYALKQHHMSMEPIGTIKTDLPCRIFRNNKGVKFFGVVHEHPEIIMNDGLGHVQLLGDVEIAHYGYHTEAVRRKRFARNIKLLKRDREKYPERILGKFLWMRDLAQLNQYELESNGGHITHEMQLRAKEGIEIWEWLIDEGHLRMATDGLQFYSMLVHVLGGGFDMSFKMDSSKLNGGPKLDHQPEIAGHFMTIEHARKLQNAHLDNKTKTYDSRYF